jgi:hypothetical protein
MLVELPRFPPPLQHWMKTLDMMYRSSTTPKPSLELLEFGRLLRLAPAPRALCPVVVLEERERVHDGRADGCADWQHGRERFELEDGARAAPVQLPRRLRSCTTTGEAD